MAVSSISNVEITDTFQVWLNRTNDVVDIVRTKALTASVSNTDITVGNATLEGTFTANTIIAFNLLRSDTFASRTGGSFPVTFTSPISANTGAAQTSLSLASSLGARSSYSSPSVTWNLGFENTTTNAFIVSTSTALTPTVKITTAGEVIAAKFTGAVDGTANTANRFTTARSIGMTGDVAWSIAAFDGSTNVTAAATINNNAVSSAKFRQSAALSIVGNATASVANVSDIAAALDGQVLRRSGTSLGFGAINLSNTDATTGVLPFSRGGLGVSTITQGHVLFGAGSSLGSSSFLFWDNTNGRLGVNNGAPTERIDVGGNVRATFFIGTATSAQYADLAEKFLPDVEYEPGTVVSVGGVNEITASMLGDKAIGVISTDPALMMNSELVGGQYVALKGRVPVKVVDNIQKGDKLVPGNNGCAMKAPEGALNVFGIALSNTKNGFIEAVIL